MRTSTLLLCLGALIAAAAGGCGHHFELRAPDDFVVLDEGAQERRGYALRATSADGVVLAVREIEDERHGSRTFWVDAIRNRLRRAGGYALLGEEEVRAASGQTGHRMRFGRDDASRPYHYWITVFVVDGRLTVVEAGGRRERFEERREQIERALAAIRLR